MRVIDRSLLISFSAAVILETVNCAPIRSLKKIDNSTFECDDAGQNNSFLEVPDSLVFGNSIAPIELDQQNHYFEGDIIRLDSYSITKFVNDAYIHDSFIYDEEADQLLRNAIRHKKFLWSGKVVPFAVSAEFKSQERTAIAMAMEEIQRKSCIRFISKLPHHVDFIYFRRGPGCGSPVGRQGGRQELILESGCMFKGILLHELLHSLGFFHEQSRADRDLFVTVQLQNVLPDMEFNFKKYDFNMLSHLGVSYDYFSIMHYGPRAFSRNGEPTLVPTQPGVTIGQRKELSEVDVYKLNKLYRCPQRNLFQSPHETQILVA